MKKDRGALCLLAAAVLWSTGGVFSKLIHWDGLTVAVVRGAVAFFALAIGRRTIWSTFSKASYSGAGWII